MAIRDLLEIVLSYVQYFVLLISISPSPFPSYYQTPLTVLSYVNLDFAQLFNKKDGPLVGQLPSNWPIDVRLQFIAVSVVLPLLLAFTGLLSLAPKQFILWYSVLLCGTFCICIAIFAIAVNDPLVISAVGSQNILVLLYSGIGCIVACVASALIWYMCSRSDVEAKKNRTYEEIMEDEVGAIDCGAVFFRCVYVVVGAFFGLLLIGAFEVPQIMHKGTLGVFGFSLGVVLAFIAFVLFVWTAIGLHRNGRLIQFHIGEVVKNNFLSVLLLLISLLYIPAVTNVVLIINCHDVTCAAHQRFVDGSTDVYYPSNYTSSCEACSFPAQECSGSLQYQLCGTSVTSSRLYFDNSVQCSELQQYFWPASGIMFVSYVLAMPIINYVLTARSTRILASDFPLDMQESLGLTDVEAFEEKVHASDNVAKFIYDPFQLRWRHWRMLFLFQKLTTVLAASFVISSPDITSAQVGLDLSAFIHLICLCYIVFTRPFKRKVENYLTIATQLMLTVGCGIGVVAVNGVSVSDNVWLAAAISAAAVPFLAFVIGAGLTARDSRIKREARERRIQKAIETVEEADEDEVQDLYGDEARDTDDEEEMGTLRGLPSQANLTRRKSLRERAVKKITVKTAQSPKANNMTESSAVARRKEKKKAGKPGDLSPPPLDLGGDITVLSDDDEVSPLHPSGMSPPVKPTIPHPPEDKSRRGAAPSRVVVKVEENKTGCGAPPKHTLGPGHHKSPPPSSLQGPTHNPLAAPIVILPPSLVPAGKGNASSPRNAAFGMMSKRIPNTAAQSARAKHRWAQAKMWVLRKVREEMLRREEEEDAKGNNGSPSSSPRNKKKKMAGWDKLMVMLMKKNATQMAKKHAGRNVTDEAELRKIDSGLHEMASFEQRHSMTEDELKARLRDIYDHHMRKVQDEQKAVDFRINDDITGILHIFFMAIGLFAFIALGCCVLGVIKYSESLYFTGPTAASATKTADTEFVGYLTWIGFTSNCCCLPYSNQTHSTILDLEKWTCSNGQVKERIRSQSNFPLADVTPANTKAFNLTSGLILRPICAADFSYGCTLAVDNVTGAISVQECTAAFPSSTLALW